MSEHSAGGALPLEAARQKVHTFSMSLAGLFPHPGYDPFVRHLRLVSQASGDLMHRASLLLNFHYTRLAELNEYPLYHAPIATPGNIIYWAQRLIIDPAWSGNQGDEEVLDLLRESYTLLAAGLKSSLQLPGQWGELLSSRTLSFNLGLYATNMGLHFTTNLERRVIAAFRFQHGDIIDEGYKKWERKPLFGRVVDYVTEATSSLLPSVPSDPDHFTLPFVTAARASLRRCREQAEIREWMIIQEKATPFGFSDDVPDTTLDVLSLEEWRTYKKYSEVFKDLSLNSLLERQPLAFVPFFRDLQQALLLPKTVSTAFPAETQQDEDGDDLEPVQQHIFSLLPICTRRRIFVNVDDLLWSQYLKAAGVADCLLLPLEEVLTSVHLKRKFGTRLPFAGSFTTDGFKVCVRFGLKGKQARSDAHEAEKTRVIEGCLAAKTAKTQFAKEPCELRIEKDFTPESIRTARRLAGIDPGKVTAITAVVSVLHPPLLSQTFEPERQYPKVTVSGGELLEWQGRTRSHKEDAKLRKRFKMLDPIFALSLLPQATSSETWITFIGTRISQFMVSNRYHFQRQRSRNDFQTYSARQRAVDEAANRLGGKVARPVPPIWRKQQIQQLHRERVKVHSTFMEHGPWLTMCRQISGDLQRLHDHDANALKHRTEPRIQATVIAFGDANVQQGRSSKGGPKLPMLTLKRHLARRQEIAFGLIGENQTSQICSLAHPPASLPHKVAPCCPPTKPKKQIWGVRACQGDSGQPPRFIGRDINSARSMLYLAQQRGQGLPRPEHFTNAHWIGKSDPRDLPYEPVGTRRP